MGKNTVYLEFGTILSFMYPLGSWKVACGERGLLYVLSMEPMLSKYRAPYRTPVASPPLTKV
jgi:hypothetical protein